MDEGVLAAQVAPLSALGDYGDLFREKELPPQGASSERTHCAFAKNATEEK